MKKLQAISGFLARQTSVFIISVAVLTFFFPELFRWVKGDMQTVVLGVIMLTMGMTLSTEDFKVLAARPLDIFIGACAQYTIMPFLAWALVKICHLPPGIATGLILVGCCPGGVSSNIISFLCKGDLAFSVGMTTASTLLAPVMTPLLVLHLSGESIAVDAWGMFRSILIVTILPVAIGAAANFRFGKSESYHELCKVMPGISVIAFACIVGSVISYNGKHFFTSGLTIFGAIFLHNGLGYLLGYFVGSCTRMGTAKRRTIAIEVGMQNAGLATNLAMKHFTNLPEAAVAAAVSCVWHSISGTLLAGLFLLIDKIRSGHAKINHKEEACSR
ncbi:MAG: bile acid:sodium symporter family protein [Victivallaceae bacterium]|nr:bile acid:sodium symporter family protein [Victivallaceae bacterium]